MKWGTCIFTIEVCCMGCGKMKTEAGCWSETFQYSPICQCKIYSMYFEVFSPLWANIFLVCLLALHYFPLVFLFDIFCYSRVCYRSGQLARHRREQSHILRYLPQNWRVRELIKIWEGLSYLAGINPFAKLSSYTHALQSDYQGNCRS